MNIWVILWGDGYECNDVFIEAWTDEAEANRRVTELNASEKSKYCEYYIQESELDKPNG